MTSLTVTQVGVLLVLASLPEDEEQRLYRGKMRTAESLVNRGLAYGSSLPRGGGMYRISGDGRAALAKARPPRLPM